ncbi:MAG: tetratricopeptide repeat protein [Owenweeksia sp.]
MKHQNRIEEIELLLKKEDHEKALKMILEYPKTASEKHQGRLAFLKGNLLFTLKQPDSALTAYNRAYEWAVLAENKELQSRILINSGAVYTQTGHHLKAIEKFNLAIPILKDLQNDALLASIQFNLALSYKEIGAYDNAISLALEASEKFKTLNIQKLQAKCYQTIGNIHREIQKDSLSLYFHKKALSYYTEQENRTAMASVLNDMGNTYKQLLDYEEALKYYRQSMVVGDSAFNPVTFGNMAEVYQMMEDFGKAEEYYLKSIKLREATGDLKAFAYSLNSLGGLYVELEKYDKAKSYLKEAAKIAGQQEYLDIQLKAFELQWQLYEKKGNLDTAYLFLKGLSELKERYYNRERQEIIEQKTAELGLRELQTAITKLSRENKINRLLAQKEQSAKRTYLTIALLLLFTLGIVIYAFIQSRKNVRLQQKLTRLEQARKIEVQHRTKNFLQTLVNFIQFQLRTTGNKDAKAAMKDSLSRVNAMLKIHSSLESKDGERVDFNSLLRDLTERIQLTFQENIPNVAIEWDVEKVDLRPDEAALLGLITNELLTNAFKYALGFQPDPKLIIHMKVHGETLLLSIKDNGPGVKEGLKNEETKGIKLVSLFARQLNGSFNLDNDNGAVATIKVKIKPAA